MSALPFGIIAVIAVAAVLGAGCMQQAPVQSAGPATGVPNLSVPFAPVPVPSRDGVNLAYEIELEPPEGQVPVVEKVEVIDPASGKSVFTLDGELLEALYHPTSVPPPSPAELQEGTGKLPRPRISVWLLVSPDAVPDRLTHRITLNRTSEGLPAITLSGPYVAVRKDLHPVVIGPPMKGKGWLALETTGPLTHHFRAQITSNGVTRVPQRYAQDWIYLDPVTGQAAAGNASIARNYYGFNKEIYSVAAGTVMEASDGLEDIATIYSAPPGPVESLAGNYVIVDIGNGKYACYAHMVNGSVRVKPGDTVTEGQVLGLMGNSGNSDVPHLHFQVVTDIPSFLGAEGYPHVYRSFDQIGEVNLTRAIEKQSSPSYTNQDLWSEFGSFVEFLKQPLPQQNRLMENNAVVDFH